MSSEVNVYISSSVSVVVNKFTTVIAKPSVFYVKIFLPCEIKSDAKLKLFFFLYGPIF